MKLPITTIESTPKYDLKRLPSNGASGASLDDRNSSRSGRKMKNYPPFHHRSIVALAFTSLVLLITSTDGSIASLTSFGRINGS